MADSLLLPPPIQSLPRPRSTSSILKAAHAIRFVPLYRDGEIVAMVPVIPEGMVESAARELGARLVAVQLVPPPER